MTSGLRLLGIIIILTIQPAFAAFGPIAFDAKGIELIGWLPVSEMGAGITLADAGISFVSASGREYVLVTHDLGTSIFEVSRPSDPTLVVTISGPVSTHRDVVAYRNFAYVGAEAGSGIQVIDLSSIDDGIIVPLQNVTTGGTPKTHTLTVNAQTGYLYRCGGGMTFGFRIYDLTQPASPEFVGVALTTRYVHDVHVAVNAEGRELAYCFTALTSVGIEPGVDILDVTDKSNIRHLAFVEYAQAGFAHQGWLSADGRYLYVNDEDDERAFNLPTTTHVLDVSRPSEAREVAVFTNGNSAVDHNLYVRDQFIYEANYRSGLRVYDATEPTFPQEIAYFDTHPEDDRPFTGGLNDTDPFLPSGIILGIDDDLGLFIWRMGAQPVRFDYPGGRPERITSTHRTLRVNIAGLDLHTQRLRVLAAPSSSLGHRPYQEIPVSKTGPSEFEASLPVAACGERIHYYVEAQMADGQAWRDPPSAPYGSFVAHVARAVRTVREDDLESPQSWRTFAMGDTATDGRWIHSDPNGTQAQPEDDHSPGKGRKCWVTGLEPHGLITDINDVDNGCTTLTSPELNLTGLYQPLLGYWRWYHNNSGSARGEDVFAIDISASGTKPWIRVETVGPNSLETRGTWVYHEFRVRDFVAPTDRVRLRFIACDAGADSTIKALIDDLRVLDAEGTEGLYADVNADGLIDVDDLLCACCDSFRSVPCGGLDIAPCGGDGAVNWRDTVAVLNAFVGNPECPGLCGE